MEISNITDPRYLSDAPKEPEVFECGLCAEKYPHRLDTWNTAWGVYTVCASCFDEHTKEGTHILIELIKTK
jgi:hypothetical protein